MALPQGIACRASNAFVTDVSPDFCENGVPDADTQIDTGEADYPTTSTQGNNCGWETVNANGIQCRNRNNSNVRLAGTHQCTNATDVNTWRLDLPSTGDKIIRQASGDFNYTADAYVELFDTTTSLGTLSTGTTSAAAKWKDATNVERTSAADWAANNAPVTKTFATTILRFKIGSGTVGGTMSFFFVDSGDAIPGANAPTIRMRARRRQGVQRGLKSRLNIKAWF